MMTFWAKKEASFLSKTTMAHFGQLLVKVGLLFISISGHTGFKSLYRWGGPTRRGELFKFTCPPV